MDILDAQKKVIKELSCNRDLFRKELIKTIGWLNSHQLFQFHSWVKSNFNESYNDIIGDVFSIKSYSSEMYIS